MKIAIFRDLVDELSRRGVEQTKQPRRGYSVRSVPTPQLSIHHALAEHVQRVVRDPLSMIRVDALDRKYFATDELRGPTAFGDGVERISQVLGDVFETRAIGELEWVVLVRSVPQNVVRQMDRRLQRVEFTVAAVVDVVVKIERRGRQGLRRVRVRGKRAGRLGSNHAQR